VYEEDGPLESMDDIIIRTERGVREVTTEESGQLKGYTPSWGTTAKDRRRIIQEPSLHFWSVLGDTFAPTFTHQENPKLEPNEEYDGIYTSIPPLSPRPSPGQVELPPNMDPHLNGRILIYKREESVVKHD
jgi:hypothetical protein